MKVSGLLQYEGALHIQHVQELGTFTVFSILLQQTFQKVKHSGSLTHFSIAKLACWTDNI